VKQNEDNYEVYDDNKLDHVLCGPDYGQHGDTKLVWNNNSPKKFSQMFLSASNNSILLIEVINISKTS